jgi:helicase required for RNAi-mediated heterochromatin assembly 1
VQVLGLTFAHSHGVCVKVSFSLNRAGKQIRWQQSKRLIPGTLVCLSHDNFETFKVATVAARPMVGLEFNPPEVDLIFNVDELEIDVTKPMVMVESRQGYFEAYKWVLRAIQRMNEDNMPLGEHIVLLDQNVKPPKYLEENPVYNLTSIFPDIPNKEVVEEVNILEDWPEGVRTSLDHSQTDALKTILTKSVAVIQGPPGTGKTYTSVRALHALLQNMTEDDPPVIVACQTNHALDQLLRHVYKFEHEIIRLGGRTQDREDIKKRTLYNVRKGSQVRIHRRPEHSIRREMDEVRDRMCQALSPISADLISPDCLFELGLITEKQMESFEKGWQEWVTAATDDVPKSSISMWLRESIVPVEKVDDVYLEVEDGEIDYEALLDLEAEYLGSNNDEDDVKDELSGTFYRMKHDYHVSCPPGISDAEIRRALKTQNLWELSENLRAAAYCQWEQKAAKIVRNKLKDLNKEFQALVGKVKIARMEKDSYLMSRAKLVGMTTTGLSKYRSLVASCQPKVILIEEAAECLEAPVLVGCLPSIQHMILVGDHKQLKGKCNVAELQGEPYNLDVSMFERWVYNDMPYVALRTQRRKFAKILPLRI